MLSYLIETLLDKGERNFRVFQTSCTSYLLKGVREKKQHLGTHTQAPSIAWEFLKLPMCNCFMNLYLENIELVQTPHFIVKGIKRQKGENNCQGGSAG